MEKINLCREKLYIGEKLLLEGINENFANVISLMEDIRKRCLEKTCLYYPGKKIIWQREYLIPLYWETPYKAPAIEDFASCYPCEFYVEIEVEK